MQDYNEIKDQLKDGLDKKSMNYVPTWDEAGVPKSLQLKLETEWEDPIKNAENEKKVEAYISAYQLKHRERLKKKQKQSQDKKELRLAGHWYNRLHKEEIEKLIEASRAIADDVFDELTQKVSTSWELNYMELLRVRVKNSPIELTAASNDKVKRFPAHNFGRGTLDGSSYSFYRLWAHVFPARSGKVARHSVG